MPLFRSVIDAAVEAFQQSRRVRQAAAHGPQEPDLGGKALKPVSRPPAPPQRPQTVAALEQMGVPVDFSGPPGAPEVLPQLVYQQLRDRAQARVMAPMAPLFGAMRTLDIARRQAERQRAMLGPRDFRTLTMLPPSEAEMALPSAAVPPHRGRLVGRLLNNPATRAAYDVARTDIPGPVRRPLVEGVERVVRASPATSAGVAVSDAVHGAAALAGIDTPRAEEAAAEVVVPRELWEVGVEFIPGVGSVPDAVRVLRGGGDDALRLAGRLAQSDEGRRVLAALADESGMLDPEKLGSVWRGTGMANRAGRQAVEDGRFVPNEYGAVFTARTRSTAEGYAERGGARHLYRAQASPGARIAEVDNADDMRRIVAAYEDALDDPELGPPTGLNRRDLENEELRRDLIERGGLGTRGDMDFMDSHHWTAAVRRAGFDAIANDETVVWVNPDAIRVVEDVTDSADQATRAVEPLAGVSAPEPRAGAETPPGRTVPDDTAPPAGEEPIASTSAAPDVMSPEGGQRERFPDFQSDYWDMEPPDVRSILTPRQRMDQRVYDLEQEIANSPVHGASGDLRTVNRLRPSKRGGKARNQPVMQWRLDDAEMAAWRRMRENKGMPVFAEKARGGGWWVDIEDEVPFASGHMENPLDEGPELIDALKRQQAAIAELRQLRGRQRTGAEDEDVAEYLRDALHVQIDDLKDAPDWITADEDTWRIFNRYEKAYTAARDAITTGKPVPAWAREVAGEPLPRPWRDMNPAQRLARFLRSAPRLKGEQLAIRKAELAQRVARGARALDEGEGDEAFRGAKGALKGRFSQPAFDAPPLAPDDWADMAETVRTSDLSFFEKINAKDGLEAIAAGELPEPRQIELLRRVFNEPRLKVPKEYRHLRLEFPPDVGAYKGTLGDLLGPEGPGVRLLYEDGTPVQDTLADMLGPRGVGGARVEFPAGGGVQDTLGDLLGPNGIGDVRVEFPSDMGGWQGTLGDLLDARTLPENVIVRFPSGRARQATFGDELAAALVDKTPSSSKVMREVYGVLGAPRALKTILDVSGTLRQMAITGASHPTRWARAFGRYVRSFVSEAQFDEIADDIARAAKQGPAQGYSWFDVGGTLGSRELHEALEGEAREAQFSALNGSWASRMIEKLPGAKASQRGFAIGVDDLRVTVYNDVARDMYRSGVRDLDQYVALRKTLEHGTGKSELTMGRITSGLNAFFAPKFVLSRFQVVLDPLTQPGSLLRASARREAARQLVAFVGYNATVLGFVGVMSKLSGVGQVELDPRSADWGKARFGAVRVDLTAGLGPVVRLVAQLATAQRKDQFGRINDARRIDIAQRFLRSKLGPPVGKTWDTLEGKDYIGDEVDWTDPANAARQIQDLVIPLIIDDIMEATREAGWQGGLVAGVGSFFGASVQSYSPTSEQHEREVRAQVKDKLAAAGIPDREQVFQSDEWRRTFAEAGLPQAQRFDSLSDLRNDYVEYWTARMVEERGFSPAEARARAERGFDRLPVVRRFDETFKRERLAFWREHPELLEEAAAANVEDLSAAELAILRGARD